MLTPVSVHNSSPRNSGRVWPAQLNLPENTLTDIPRLVYPWCILNLNELTMRINRDTWIQSPALHQLGGMTQGDQTFKAIPGSIATLWPFWDPWNPVSNKTKRAHTEKVRPSLQK